MAFSPRNLWQLSRLDLKRVQLLGQRVLLRLLGAAVLGVLLVLHLHWRDALLPFLSLTVLCVLSGLFWRFHLRRTPVRNTTPHRAEWMVWTASFLSLFGVQMVGRLVGADGWTASGFMYLAPMVAGAMLVAALLGPAQAIVSLSMLSLLLGLSGALPVSLVAAAWISGAISAHAVDPLKRRGDLFRAVSVQLVANAVVACCVMLLDRQPAFVVLESVAWAALAAVLATSIFWLGVLLLERAFGIVSDWTLLELCSPENPLLRELCMKAPGTYAHSVMVGNLAENAARAIGANPVLVRAMAYYHDIGKMVRPSFFIENQVGDNAHDAMSPSLSAKVIFAHVQDGAELAKRHRLPRVIIDGIRQHHGTSLMRYFFSRALLTCDEGIDDPELERSYRYPGPKPLSREAAILHLADMLEATSRTWPKDGSIDELVDRIVETSRSDGQLDECELTFRELRSLRDSFVQSLAALRHDRVTYPEQEAFHGRIDAAHQGAQRVVSTLKVPSAP